jgi:Uma2 family endonuclease
MVAREPKPRCWSNVPDYWIVNLQDRQLEVRRTIVANRRREFGFDYADLSVYQPGDRVAPLARPKAKIKVSDLLP